MTDDEINDLVLAELSKALDGAVVAPATDVTAAGLGTLDKKGIYISIREHLEGAGERLKGISATDFAALSLASAMQTAILSAVKRARQHAAELHATFAALLAGGPSGGTDAVGTTTIKQAVKCAVKATVHEGVREAITEAVQELVDQLPPSTNSAQTRASSNRQTRKRRGGGRK